MAYMDQAKKKELAPGIKRVLKKYGMKGTLGVNHHSTLVINISSGPIDFGVDHHQVNHYWIERNYQGESRDFLKELKDAAMRDNHDNSDIMTDYIDVGYYLDINIGRWNKPYTCTKEFA